MSNVIIIGNGPAGISAALYTARAGIDTTIIGKDSGALSKADKIENYFGFENPISGETLVNNGIEQAKHVGATVISGEVVGISLDEKLVVSTVEGSFTADSVILATGSSRKAPPIQGLVELEGKGVSYCATCDAFFYRGKDVAVLGEGEYAIHEATELLATSRSVALLTNGKEPTADVPEGVAVHREKIEALNGDSEGFLQEVVFQDGTSLPFAGLFIAIGVAGSSALANKLGAQTNGGKIVVDESMATNVPGLFAAGDCTGGLLQISKAVYDGAKAGVEVIKYLRGLKS